MLLDLANQHNRTSSVVARVVPRRGLMPTVAHIAVNVCHRLERRYRRTYRPDDRCRWVEATRRRFAVYRSKREQYWSDRLLQCQRSSAALWRSMSSVLGRQRDVTASTSHTAQGFADFFRKKIDDIRSATSGRPPPPVITRASSPPPPPFSLIYEVDKRNHVQY